MARQLSRVDSVEIGADANFERTWHQVQRAAWVFFGVLVALGLAGLFGRGWLAHATAGSTQDPMRIEYERFARFASPGKLKVFFTSGAVRNGQIVLLISKDLAETLQLNRTSPPPISVQPVDDGQMFTFSIAGDPRESTITFSQNPQRFGRLPGRIAVSGGNAVEFRQLIYP